MGLLKYGAIEHFSDAVMNAITIDGEIRKMPLGVHIDGMIYYNTELETAAGVDPTSWASLDNPGDWRRFAKPSFDHLRSIGH